MQQSGIIYQYKEVHGSRLTVHRLEQNREKNVHRVKTRASKLRIFAFGLIAFALGGLLGPLSTPVRMEAAFLFTHVQNEIRFAINPPKLLPPSTPVFYNPLVTPNGASIDPIDQNFSIIVPKIGINAKIIPGINPSDANEYLEALTKGVAHAATSFFPDEAGTVYLFSHSTNYDWFVGDLNAVFYLLKNLEAGDTIVLIYQKKQYIYTLREKRIVKPNEISYLVPQSGTRSLILQTCWPPGSTSERLLIFADFMEVRGESI